MFLKNAKKWRPELGSLINRFLILHTRQIHTMEVLGLTVCFSRPLRYWVLACLNFKTRNSVERNKKDLWLSLLNITCRHVVASLTERSLCLIQNQSQCLVDLCGALHCDIEINFGLKKSKCNPAAAARNKHLCESLADSCFPVNDGPAASRLHEFFLHQFCDAHSCTGSRKPFSRDRRRDENGNSTVEVHISNWQKEKTILIDRSVVFGSSLASPTLSESIEVY
ncbi:uncharacterized protein LOC130968739 isoform X3 [Arachis stenosperma]|uniref:uncharacterized protein LOC130968739 isoform X3 n=1 Tax=Arachis stenosperma TaxID=217475 RepID=UPI0025AC3F9A|nr:uncharacterized protein LOC130968739 isoform X3 [Arachis stenosperma]XP_057750161.1 uncharacterized protein LOC130968739 isoform X3 [Arachis stenosperma]